jgi:signal transduction histidine kinase
MKRFSITDKLIIASLVLSIITITLVASYSFTNAKNAILDRTFSQLTSVKVIKENVLDRFFNNCIREVQIAGASSDIVQMTELINQYKTQKNELAQHLNIEHQSFLKEIKEAFYHRIFIVGEDHHFYPIKYASDYLKDKQELEITYGNWEFENHLKIEDYHKINDSLMVIIIYTPIYNLASSVVGHLVFELNSSSIDSIMLEHNPAHGLGKSGESYLVAQDYLMRSSSRFQEQSILKTQVKTKAVEASLNGEEGIDVIDDYRGIKVLSSYKKLALPQLNWVIISEMDYKEATIPIYRIRNEIIFLSIFIFSLVLGVIYVLSKRITIPIQQLNNAAKEVGSGNLDVDIPIKLGDEIGELTTSFNQMAIELKEERKKSLGSLIDGQDFERQRLSRELHDGLGQSLIGLKLKYESCISNNNQQQDKDFNYHEVSALIDETIEETRRISNNLMPAALKEFGLFTAMRHLSNEIANHTNIHISFQHNGKDQLLPDKIKIYLFRITQECISNIIKHSQAQKAEIKILILEEQIYLEVKDDGIGYDPEEVKERKSNGLTNLKDRVKLLNGQIIIEAQKNEGSKIHIEIPLKTDHNE